MKRFLIMIPTSNRPKMLARLVRHIAREAETYACTQDDIFVDIVVCDDGSTPPAQFGFQHPTWSKLVKVHFTEAFPTPNGAKGWWRTIDRLFRFAGTLENEYDFVGSIQDDMQLDHVFFERFIKLFEALEGGGMNPIAVNLLTDLDRATIAACGSHQPKLYPKYSAWDNGWVDMCFLARPRALDVVGWSAQAMATYKYTGRGSGVGDWYSRVLREHGTIWKSRKTFVYHGGHRSQMHPWREKTGTRVPQTLEYPYDD